MTAVVRVERVTYVGDDPAADPNVWHERIDVPWPGHTVADVLRDDRYRACRHGGARVTDREVTDGRVTLRVRETTTLVEELA